MMSWFFEGNGEQIGFSVSQNGVLSAYGVCSQECRPVDPLMAAHLPHTRNAEGSWSICTPANEERKYDGGLPDPIRGCLKNFFAENGEKAVGRIGFFPAKEGQQPLVGLSILAPNDFAASAFTLLKAAMGNPSFRFLIVAEFRGLYQQEEIDRAAETAAERGVDVAQLAQLGPTVSEFTNPDMFKRRAYFSKEISLSVRTFDTTGGDQPAKVAASQTRGGPATIRAERSLRVD
jgi:hypothetical protein